MELKKHSWKELFTDPDGSYSHTKVWSNIANFVASIAFLYNTYKYQMSAELLGTFVLAISAQRVASKYLDKPKENLNVITEEEVK